MSFKRAGAWSVFYVALALLAAVVIGLVSGWSLAAQYLAGYVVEKSLSIDNLFVFVIIVGAFSVPVDAQPRALSTGIALALVLRAVFIAAGAVLLDAFSVTFAIFGLALIATAVQLFRHRHEDPSVGDNPLVALVRRRLPLSEAYDGRRLFTRVRGRRRATPLLLALLAIGTTDLLFALDSIPAVYGVTREPAIVLAANVFALLGLRSLFFLVSGLLDRLVYLSTGLALILAFIGIKLVLHFAHLHSDAVPEVSTGLSIAVIAAILTVTAFASLRRTRRAPRVRARAGSLRGARPGEAAGIHARPHGSAAVDGRS